MILLYIDPGMGFLALQMLAGGLLGGVFVFRKRVEELAASIILRFRRRSPD